MSLTGTLPPEMMVAHYRVSRYDLVRDGRDLLQYVRKSLVHMMMENIGEKLLCGTPVVVRTQWLEVERFDTNEIEYQIRAYLQHAERMEVRYADFTRDFYVKPMDEKKEIIKVICAACMCVWHDNGKGACSACGAPGGWTFNGKGN